MSVEQPAHIGNLEILIDFFIKQRESYPFTLWLGDESRRYFKMGENGHEPYKQLHISDNQGREFLPFDNGDKILEPFFRKANVMDPKKTRGVLLIEDRPENYIITLTKDGEKNYVDVYDAKELAQLEFDRRPKFK